MDIKIIRGKDVFSDEELLDIKGGISNNFDTQASDADCTCNCWIGNTNSPTPTPWKPNPGNPKPQK